MQNFIEEVMELVELNPLRSALVGMPGRSGLSVEQRKRLTIAVELVANPSIIFMCALHPPMCLSRYSLFAPSLCVSGWKTAWVLLLLWMWWQTFSSL